MASHPHTSPTAAMPSHHQPPPGHQPNGHPVAQQPKTLQQILSQVNEGAWIQIGSISELQGDIDNALSAYEQALRHNAWSVPAMSAMASILRNRDRFDVAVEYLKNILKIEPNNGETWGSLGHCYLMMDNLTEAYSAYQQALYHLADPKDPKLWYGIGILYDRYGSLEHAEEAFSQVMRMNKDFEKANEIYFRLGIIYKQQQKYQQSLECFKYIVSDPPRPLTEEDIWFQIGHVHEQQKDFDNAKAAYKRVLDHDPKHAKVLQQLGWLHHQQSNSFQSQEQAIDYLEKSVNSDQTDAQSWYLLGRCYMAQQKYPKAYEAYQQAVYRDGRNPTFWCSIGVLYYQINQYRDALDAYSRAIRLNPNISEVWYDLGTLYESCNNQIADALDAYQRAADLDPTNIHIKARLQLLQSGQTQSGMPNQNSAPLPQDVHPQAYQPAPANGPPGPQWGGPAPTQPSVHAPQPPTLDYNRRLAEIQQHPQPPPQQLQQVHAPPFDQQRERRPPGPPPIGRLASPRQQEPPRHYPEPPQHSNATPRRGMSPSPKSQNAVLHHQYQGPSNLPPPPPVGQPQPPPPPSSVGPQRITNPNYGPPSANSAPPASGPPPGPSGPYMRSPPPEVRPIIENRPASSSSNYPPQGYAHHASTTSAPSIAMGAPAPTAALAAAEAAARDRDRDQNDRTPAPKRLREWEEDSRRDNHQAPDEKRPRLDDHVPRPPSVATEPKTSPTQRRSLEVDMRRSEEQRRAEDQRRADDQRRANESYHPSEAAHHPQLPAVQQSQAPAPQQPAHPQSSQPPQQQGRLSEPLKEEPRREPQVEPAARKMEVDENYDDEEADAADSKVEVKRSHSTKPEREASRPPPQSVAVGGD